MTFLQVYISNFQLKNKKWFLYENISFIIKEVFTKLFTIVKIIKPNKVEKSKYIIF